MAQILAFDAWMVQVDNSVQGTAGVSVLDLPDSTFMDWFEDGYSPSEAAREAISEAGGE